MKDYLDFDFGIISSLGIALNKQYRKNNGVCRITAYASYYKQIADMAVNGKKKEREAAVMFLLEQMQNNAAMLYNEGIDMAVFRKDLEHYSDVWNGKIKED